MLTTPVEDHQPRTQWDVLVEIDSRPVHLVIWARDPIQARQLAEQQWGNCHSVRALDHT